MPMLDYPAIAALAAVIETQSFEKAAQKLFITQSAISQRIKLLEKYSGEPLLIRTLPYKPTQLGQKLLSHYQQILLLEENLKSQITEELSTPSISIGISRDSLETWFTTVIDKLQSILPLTLKVIAYDQEVTLEYLRKGLVSACASTCPNAISGCKADFLGYFDYVLVASPEFKHKYFNTKKSIKEKLLKSPSIAFDSQDELHKNYLKHFFNITEADLIHHVIPSIEGFRQFALKGYAYALIPEIDILDDLKNKRLINLFPDKVWKMPVYWHSWIIENSNYKKFNELVVKAARKILRIRDRKF